MLPIILLSSLLLTTTVGASPAPQTGFSWFCKGKEDGNYPHPWTCHKYIACVGSNWAYEMQCPTGPDGTPLHFNPNLGHIPANTRCDYADKAGCLLPY